MKKTLLICLAAAAGIGSVSAEFKEPVVLPDFSAQRISANGKYLLSEVYGTVIVYDLENGTSIQFTDTDYPTFSLGNGNCITADGTLFVGCTHNESDAAYCLNGEWYQLDVPDAEKVNLSQGVCADGSRICGGIGLNDLTLDEVIMHVPAYWDRKADGTGYGDAQLLPYPTKDLFGETPQYITAICISDDGKTIAGQMVFSSGRMAIPVVYKEGADGEWTYTLPTKHLFNPEGLEPVENPGDGPAYPSEESFLTEEELARYNEAVQAFYDSGYTLPYPEYTDYMSEEELAAYKEAKAEYEKLQEEWKAKYDAYTDYYDAVCNASPNFLFNNVWLSLDGKSIVSTLESEDPNADPWSWFRANLYTPCTVDIATGELTKVETDLSLLTSGVANDGIILAYNGQDSTPMLGYVIKDGKVQPVSDYLNEINPEYGEWIKKNITHEVVTGWDPETYEETIEELTYTGMPIATPDMSIVAFWNNCPWYFYEIMAESYVFNVNENLGVAPAVISRNNMTVKNGQLIVPGEYVGVNIYDISGTCVKSVNTPAGAVNLDFGKGIYIAKGVRADGSETVLKFGK